MSEPTVAAESSAAPHAGRPSPQLSLWDCTAIIVGIIIGSGLYETAPLIAANVSNAAMLAGVWLAGGAFALVGALCYAELAIAYPRDGGDYVYLTRAFGRSAGFLFAWAQLWVIRPGSIGTMAYVFGRYATSLLPLGSASFVIYALGSVAVLTVINILGVRQGARTQNVLTATKVAGLLVVVAIGLLYSAPAEPVAQSPVADAADEGSLGLALILVMFTYGGWSDMAYVAAEVRPPQRNILRALLLGTGAVTVIYLAVNTAFWHALGLGGLADSEQVAADVVALAWGSWGARAVATLVCISALGAINGMIFTGARVFYALGTDHRLFSLLGRWHPRLQTPAAALVAQSTVTLAVVLAAGVMGEGGGVDAFQRLVLLTTPLFWTFLALTGVALFVLRRRDPQPRSFGVPLFPALPLVYCAGALWMAYAGLSYAWQHRTPEAWGTIVWLAVGVVVYVVDSRVRRG